LTASGFVSILLGNKFKFVEQFVNSIVGAAEGGDPYDAVGNYLLNRELRRGL